MSSWKTECERDERSFWAVCAVERLLLARAMRPRTYQEEGGTAAQTNVPDWKWRELSSYLILAGHLLVGEVGDGHLAAGLLADLVLGPLAGFAGVEEVAQRLVVDLDEARREGELRKHKSLNPSK